MHFHNFMAEMRPLVSTSKSWNNLPFEPDNINSDKQDNENRIGSEKEEKVKPILKNKNEIAKKSPSSKTINTDNKSKNIYGKIAINFGGSNQINYSLTPSFLLKTTQGKNDSKVFGSASNKSKSPSNVKGFTQNSEELDQEEIYCGMSSSGRSSSPSNDEKYCGNEEEQLFEEELNDVLQGLEEPDEIEGKQSNILLNEFLKGQQGSNKSSDSMASNKAVRGTPMGSSWPFDEPTEIVGDLTEESIDITASQAADCPCPVSNLVPPLISPCASKVYDFTIQDDEQKENDFTNKSDTKEGSDNEYCEYEFNHDDIDHISVVGEAPSSSSKKRHYSFVRAIKEITENVDCNQSETDELNKAFRTLPSLIIPTDRVPTGLTPRSSPLASPFSKSSPKKKRSTPRKMFQYFSFDDLPDYFAPEEPRSTLGGCSFSIGRRIPKKFKNRDFI